ncbi:hypothetical protein BSN85_35320 [Bradyrhizobium brasilense]|nr:hypothetical protein BSN85_35320 [Bradyrhizobium brasilense]
MMAPLLKERLVTRLLSETMMRGSLVALKLHFYGGQPAQCRSQQRMADLNHARRTFLALMTFSEFIFLFWRW